MIEKQSRGVLSKEKEIWRIHFLRSMHVPQK